AFLRDLAVAVGRRRQLTALGLGAAVIPLMTVLLAANRSHVSLDDVLLLYLVTVLAITLVGGFWPAVLAAVAASLIINWYFTPPLHTFTVDAPQNLVALLLFITVAVTVSSVVHLAARRAALAGQAEVLAAGNRLRTALLTAVSHELRTPLAAVKASVSSLRQTDVRWSPDDEAELLATIEENADRLDALIANLLDMSRIHTGSLQPSLRPTSVDEVAPLAAHGLDADQVSFDIPDDLPLVATDPGLLERAIANLIGNAVRYCPPGIPTQLVARSENGHVRLDVIDHGPGVRSDMKERIFEPFQQLGDQRSVDGAERYLDGVGLGLAVARGFVEATGGSLVALDTPGGGLTMRVTLQVADPVAAP
ncbi:MAG: sensor histidine kinase, partial [Mycobacteriales bacterium]